MGLKGLRQEERLRHSSREDKTDDRCGAGTREAYGPAKERMWPKQTFLRRHLWEISGGRRVARGDMGESLFWEDTLSWLKFSQKQTLSKELGIRKWPWEAWPKGEKVRWVEKKPTKGVLRKGLSLWGTRTCSHRVLQQTWGTLKCLGFFSLDSITDHKMNNFNF